MLEITLTQVEVSIGVPANGGAGVKMLIATDPKSGIRVNIPMDTLSAIQIGNALSSGSGIVPAHLERKVD